MGNVLKITDGTRIYLELSGGENNCGPGGTFFGHPRRKSRIWLPEFQVEALRAGGAASNTSLTKNGWVTTSYHKVEG
jgi:hypothetical protein